MTHPPRSNTAREGNRLFGVRRLWCVVLVILTGLSASATFAQGVSKMLSQEARKAAEEKTLLMVDIRTPEEWKLTGVADVAVTNSMHIEGFLARLEADTGGDKTMPIGLICATGGRSASLSHFLTAQGYTNIIDISDGMLGSPAGPGWLRNELPVRPPDEPRLAQ